MIRPRSLAWLLALALAAPYGGAHAHAVQLASEPADGAVLARAPAEVVVRFNEPVAPTAVRLFDAAGARIPVEASRLGAGAAFRVALPPELADGRYVLSYRVTSADAHPVAGAVAFVVGRDIAGGQVVDVTGSNDDAAARIALRVVQDLAWMLAMGGALFLLFVAPFPHSRRVLLAASALVVVTACCGAGLHGVALLGGDANLLAGAPWKAALDSPRGTSALLAMVGAVLVGAGAWTAPAGRWRNWLVAGIAALTASALVSGHVATASPRGVALAALALHVLGAAFWGGSLVALALLLAGAQPPQPALRALRRFSGLALVAVPLLALAGVVLAVFELESLATLRDTTYGRWILVKAAVLLTLLMIAAVNRWRWMPLAGAGDAGALASLRRNVAIEIVLVAGAIGAAAALAQTPPARAQASAGFVHLVLVQRDVHLHFTLDPGRPGTNVIALQFESAAGGVVDPAEVEVEFEQREVGLGPFVRAATREGPGAYAWRGPDLALPGAWAIAVHARIGDFDRITFRAPVVLPP